MYNAWRIDIPSVKTSKENGMGTCPKCKHRIRKNGNHVKLGSVWFHKMCPVKTARSAK